MGKNSIVFTNDNCIGCNKCIKVCSAIGACISKEENGRARIEVDGSKCVACGSCIDVCVHKAREFEDDTERFFNDLKNGEKISLLLAPAFKANYPDEYESVLGGLKGMGVNRIISVSFGADICTWGYLNYIKEYNFLGGISQPCPAVVSYIERYLPELLPKLFPVQSPLMCAAIYARKELGITDKFAFISPCIAKKLEIEDEHNAGLVQYNITFEHLMRYVKEHGIEGKAYHSEIEYGLGSFYPTPGGLAENVRWFLGDQVYIRQIEGERHLYDWMHINKDRIENDKTPFLFIDALNCENGCICGTAVNPDKSRTDDALYALLDIREASKKNESGDAWSRPDTPDERLKNYNKQFEKLSLTDYLRGYTDRSEECRYELPDEKQLEDIYISMNKVTEESRKIDCTCCGYDNCRQMAVAIHNGFNHKENCIYYEKTMVHELELEKVISKEAARARAEFLANMSHEIRTPINAVLGMNEMILRESNDPNITSYSENIRSSGGMLLGFVDNLLNFSKIESGKMGTISTDFDKNLNGRSYRRKFTAKDTDVLAMDDNPMNLTVFLNLLKQTGLNIDTAQSGDEALALTDKKKYDIMFFDHMMPEKDGIETLHELRAKEGNPNHSTPVICLTANAISGAREQYISEGFNDYITKPVDYNKLEDMFIKYLPKDKICIEEIYEEDYSSDDIEDDLPDALKSLADSDLINVKTGINNSGDINSYMSLIKIFYDTLSDKINELVIFLDEGDIKNYTIKVHALKSSLRIIGAINLGEYAQKLENAGKLEDMAFISANNPLFIDSLMSVKELFKDICDNEEKDNADKKEADDDMMSQIYADIKAAAEEMDCDRLDEIMDNMKNYKVPEAEAERFSEIKKCIENFDYDGVQEALQ